MLKLFNTLTKKVETFVPLQAGKISIYVCGMTVYDFCHIGHARMFVVFDSIVRYLKSRGHQVNFVRNITDIDDKIIQRAKEKNISVTELTDHFIQIMHEDETSLGVLSPDHEPRATHYMPAMIQMIETLIAKGFAYQAENGDVYYAVNKFQNYGQLAHQNLAELEEGARVEINSDKKDPLDFVLWKMSKSGEPKWPSPWGEGRPGWHIECSAMSNAILGEHFDIHGGGIDLVFPHHQNEIAQSEAAHHGKFVNYWLHSGHVQVNKEKMSKSLGNFFTIREVLAEYDAEVVRYFILASHYRSPINYSQENLKSARQALTRFYTALREVKHIEFEKPSIYSEKFYLAMDDDFNTPEAFAVLFEMTREINRLKDLNDFEAAAYVAAEQKHLAASLGLLQNQPEHFLQTGEDSEKIEALIRQRNKARENKNWMQADALRAELAAMGIELEDSTGKTTWRRI